MPPVEITVERWLRLCFEARWMARRPELDPDTLRVTTGKLYSAPKPEGIDARNACEALRATAQWFGWAKATDRVRLAPVLAQVADETETLLRPVAPGPEAAAAALPTPPAPANEEPPVWTKRADLA